MARTMRPSNKETEWAKALGEAFDKDGCTVFKAASHVWAARSADSTVVGLPPIDLKALLKSRKLRARKSLGSIQAGVSIVRIHGSADDVESHYHISHLAGLIVLGTGWLNVPRSKGWVMKKKGSVWVKAQADHERLLDAPNLCGKKHEDVGLPVYEGDVVVIPRLTHHVFRCRKNKKMEYIALEFSDYKTDYQAHH
jgi:hypothetical protein